MWRVEAMSPKEEGIADRFGGQDTLKPQILDFLDWSFLIDLWTSVEVC
jgi:hypothetical protein